MQFQNMNQTTQTPIKGRVSLIPNPATISAQIQSASTATLYPASAVVLFAGTANMILVDKATPAQNIFGFVVWNPKKPNGWGASQKVEIALPGSVMYMESYAAFVRGSVLYQITTGDDPDQVTSSSAGGATPIGLSLDQATGADQLVRVYIQIGLTV